MADTNSSSSSSPSPAADREADPKTPETHLERGPTNDLTPVKRDHPGCHGSDSEGESSFDGSSDSGSDVSECSANESEPSYSYVDAVRLGVPDGENGGWKCLQCGRIGMQQPYHVCQPTTPDSDDDDSFLLESEHEASLHDDGDEHDDGSNNDDCETMPEHLSSASPSSTLIKNNQWFL